MGGMPMHGNPFVKGNLIIAFDVEFPSPGSLRQPALKALVDALPDKPRSGADKLGGEAEEYGMEVFTPEMLKADLEQNREAYDSDDDEVGAPFFSAVYSKPHADLPHRHRPSTAQYDGTDELSFSRIRLCRVDVTACNSHKIPSYFK